MIRIRTTKQLLSIIFCSVLLTNCNDKSEKKKGGFTYEEKASDTQKTVDDNYNIVIIGDDMMKFNLSEIKVKSGKKVKITLRHKGKMDINIMGHNFVILKKDIELVQFATKAALAKDNQYIPLNTQDTIAYTDLIGGGQTTSIEFIAPAVGVYEFLCSFPGHYGMMKGKFIVE